MYFLKEKIRIVKKGNKYYKIEKKPFSLWGISIFYFLFFYLFISKIVFEIQKLKKLNYFFLIIFSILFITLYCFFLFYNLSKETLEITKNSIIIKKYFLSYCYYHKLILTNNITIIKYLKRSWLEIFLYVLPFFINGNNSFIIQSKTDKEEDEEAYFGVGLKLKEYSEICKEIKEIIGNDYKNIEFTQFLR